MKRIRVAVIDDHAIVRAGLKCTIGAFKDFEYVGELADGTGAADFVAAVRSDVTLLDIRMPGKDGIAALEEILARNPAAKVVMLTTVGTEEDVYRSLKLGAQGYVLKDGATENIVEAIRAVAAGETYIPEEVRQVYAARCGRESLTDREGQTLRLLAEGRSNREIAAEMGISEDGVKGHLRHINEKFGTKDRVEAVAVAIRRGIIRAALALALGLGLLPSLFAAREPLSLDGSWEFRFEEGAALAEVADPAFEATDTIAVPGCYDAMPKWYLKRGTGLYRRTFTLTEPAPAAWLTIDGMGLVGRFFLDGKALGERALPYSRLRIPTGPLAAGTHTLVAALDNRLDWERLKLARPYYDFYLYGGFYHGVSLEFEARQLWVRTRDYRAGEVEIEVRESAASARTAGERTLVFDGRHAVKAVFKDGRAAVRVPDFRLWSPDSPKLHTVSLDGGLETRFGIRTIEARDGRLWLNGEPLYLKGVNRHEAHPTFGAATPESLMLADLQHLKALGCNFVRGAHYPQAQRFLDLCDEYGVLVWEESLGWDNGQPWTDPQGEELADPRFRSEQLAQTSLMVRNSFNHPSVIIFAFLNEFRSSDPGWKRLADDLIEEIRSYDSGRLISFACNSNGSDICNEHTDLIAFNTYPGWIGSDAGSPENLKGLIRRDIDKIVAYYRKRYPDKPIIVSEMGTCGEYGRHDAAGAQWTEEFEAEYVTDAMRAAFERPEICGFTIWQFTDCRSFHRGGGTIRTKPFAENLAGLYDGYRRPKLVVTEAVRRAFSEKQ